MSLLISFRDSDNEEMRSNKMEEPMSPPTHQPPMKSFKQFIASLDDDVDDDDAIAKYQEYKLEFRKTQISDYFMHHKDEEWLVRIAGLPNIVLQYYCSLKIKIARANWAKIIIAAFCFAKK